jgi:hypothetical protein
MYALARNAWKYVDRDKRGERTQLLEYDYLAPDSVNEMFDALRLMQLFTGKAFHLREGSGEGFTDDDYIQTGMRLLEENNPVLHELEIIAHGFENARRKTIITKIHRAYSLFKQMIAYYGCTSLVTLLDNTAAATTAEFTASLPAGDGRQAWLNVGGQLVPADDVEAFKKTVREGGITSWDEVHAWYAERGAAYLGQKTRHALASLEEITGMKLTEMDTPALHSLLNTAVATREWITHAIYTSRAKDYANPYRKMVYDNEKEMEKVTGSLDGNSFIKLQQAELEEFKAKVAGIKERLK